MISIPLVGMHFRPPAKQVLACLPLNTKLEIRPEPTNQFDENAIMVLVNMAEDFPISRIEMLDAMIGNPETGAAAELCAAGALQLGYVAASGAKTAKGGPGTIEVLRTIHIHGLENIEAKLGAAPEGYPTVVITVKSPETPTPIQDVV